MKYYYSYNKISPLWTGFMYSTENQGSTGIKLYVFKFVLYCLAAWFMAVQTFMTIALLASMTTLVTISLVLVRWPLQMIMRYEWHLTGFACICQAVTGKPIVFNIQGNTDFWFAN